MSDKRPMITSLPEGKADNGDHSDRPISSRDRNEKPSPKSLRFELTVFFLALVAVVGSMDAVIVSSALAAIAHDPQSSSVESFWVGTAFLLAQTVTIPLHGTTSEIFGRKGPILIALSIFLFGSILCATAQTITWLIGARVVQGIGAGGMIQPVQHDTSSFVQKLGMVDWAGLGVFTCASTLFLVWLTGGGVSHPWDSAAILAPLVLGALLFILFVFIQCRVSTRPMMPLRIFHDRSAIVGFVTSFLHGLVFGFLGALQHSVLHASLETMTCIAYSAPAGLVASIIVKRTQHFKYIIVVGWALLAAGMGTNITMHPSSTKAMLYGPRVLVSLGGGLLFPTLIFAVQARQHGDDIGIATSVQVFARSMGTAFGVGLGGVIFQNQWTQEVGSAVAAGRIPAESIVGSNVAETAYSVIRKFPETVQAVYREAYADSLAMLWWVMMGLSVGVLWLVWWWGGMMLFVGGLAGKQNFRDEGEKKEDDSCGWIRFFFHI
ncbi:MFS general substrate transporter [Aspergillus campestris IBT 28561]|uniref:MFS general substrate transporter n=1 Tax=Aspergillus campestris (strain IBT 28561) TaxID=1392248 RepID=A0A2I1DBC3_ASPC2|nr:MFS general substrate transporter [Aspergillus campestris IBT 28561]PKY07163.1 MFS general substrate transporter [Aspergillus campestris IBT 28561]